MNRLFARAALFALAPAFFAATSRGDDVGPKTGLGANPEGDHASKDHASDAEAETTRVVVVDVGTLPLGTLPAPPADTEAPTGVPAFTQPSTLTVTIIEEVQQSQKLRPPPVHRLTKVAIRKKRRPTTTKIVAVGPAMRTLDALYFPRGDVLEHDGSSETRMSCGDREPVTPLRWETLTTTPEGNASLEVRDVWFDAKTCAVGPGNTKTVALQAVAWEKGKPWLFARRSHTGVTLIMPRTGEITSESMVGAPVTVRGDFTRVTLPLGRWGSGTVVAQVDALSTGAKTESGENGDDRSVEVGIELVQTMSETTPTLLVRTRKIGDPPEQSVSQHVVEGRGVVEARGFEAHGFVD